jgi:tetratricopeptide (TPR) repeat protein
VLQGARDTIFTQNINDLVKFTERLLPSGQSREKDLFIALQLARQGKGIESATVLEAILHKNPTDLLVHQLLHEGLFWLGQAHWMRDVIEKAIPSWDETSADYGPLLSLRAFANEEAGYLKDAERYGRMSIEIDPSNIWAAHAVAHALYMQGENARGADLVEKLSPNWGKANQMRHHMWWHMCLFLLEQGDHERILQLLITEVRNPNSLLIKESPAASIDIQNVASLLLRLELYGVDVGDHWQVLSPICANRINNHGNAFGNVHDMMVLTATGQVESAEELLMSMRASFAGQSGATALAYNAIAVPACEAVLAHRRRNYKQVLELLSGIRHQFNLMGASHAQRDIFYHMIVKAAEHEGREDLRAVFIRDIERLGFSDVPNRAAYKR